MTRAGTPAGTPAGAPAGTRAETPSLTVLITGCDSGIGRALAQQFHHRGHRVIATGLHLDSMRALADLGVTVSKMDVTSADDIAALLCDLAARQEVVDVLVNNAGFGAMGPTVEMAMSDVRAQYDVNVFGALALTQAVAAAMMARRSGRIVIIGSTAGILTTPFAGVYCSTKAAVHAIGDALRMELRPFGVDVIRVEPNQIRTDFGERAATALRRRFREGSSYLAVQEAALARATASQNPGSMPAVDFACAVVDGVTARRAPVRLRIGRQLWPYTALKPFIPSRGIDMVLTNRFDLRRLAS